MNAIPSSPNPSSRRRFLIGTAAAGAGLAIGFDLSPAEAQSQVTGGLAVPSTGTQEINAWVVIKPDDTVVIRIARVEMGQGTLTGLAQLVAEELECDWSKVVTEYPTPGQSIARNRIWGNFQTAGSQGIRQSNQYVREGGAAAREMLKQAAANAWGVPVTEVTAENSVLRHAGSNRQASYGSMADAAARLTPPEKPALKPVSAWKIAGKPLKRLDTVGKLDGSQVYSIDVKLPGMLNAAIRTNPVVGGKLKSFDAAAVQRMPGVKAVVPVDDTGVAVIADTWWRAKTALDALPVTWDDGANGNYSSAEFDAVLKAGLDAPEAFVGNQKGDWEAAKARAAKVVEAVYAFPHQHHTTMEPMNATVLWTPERCQVWTATQNGEAALATAAPASGLPIGQVDVHRLHLGGGFGRRATSHDYVRQAVLIAKQLPGVPVKMIWSREEDQLQGVYHPTTMAKLQGALDDKGNLIGLRVRISGQSILAGVNPQGLQNGRDPVTFQGLNATGTEGVFGYDVPNLLIDHAMRNPPVRPGFWRGVNNNQNALYLECFMDELALAAGRDPLEFRLSMLPASNKHRAVLEAVAEKAGWGTQARPGVFRGLCQHMGYGSYVASVAEVSISNAGELKIERIVAATNCGHAVNPQQIAAQIEGSFAYGLSALLHGAITFENGRAQQLNFDTYPVLRINEMPKVESIVMPTNDFWGGVGEPTIFVAAPAVLNAIFAATGRRVRQAPISGVDLRRA